MAMLHIIRSSGFTSNALTQCLQMAQPQDSIVLMDDGCYNIQHPLLTEALLKKTEITVYFIRLHADARAQISNNASFIPSTIEQVLDLLFTHDNSITWS